MIDVSLQHPLMFLLLSAALVLLYMEWFRAFRPQIFLVISLAFIGLQFQFGARSLAVLALAVGVHYSMILGLMRFRGDVERNILFFSWLAATLFAFAVVKHYDWVPGAAFGGRFVSSQLSTIGFSFLLFRQIDLAVAVKDHLVDSVPPLTYLNYNLAFWTFLAGPIQRFENFAYEFDRFSRHTEPAEIRSLLMALNRVMLGFIKMFIVAFLLEKYIGDASFLAVSTFRNLAGLLLSYPLYLYINFSGYCDIVIGLAAAVGFELPENFRHPYLASNGLEFWTRWHITLSEFFRDYVYFPLYLAMARKGVRASLASGLAVLTSFTLMGAWHGNRLGFVIFGILHGTGVAAALAWDGILKRRLSKARLKSYRTNPAIRLIAVVAFQAFVLVSFLPFRFTGAELRAIAGATRTMLGLSA